MSDLSKSICTVFFGHWGEKDITTEMVVVPLTSCVVDGQTRWRLMSERRSESGNRGGNFSQMAPSIHKEKSHKGEKSHKCKNCTFSTRVVKADFLKAVKRLLRKAVKRLLKGCYT